MKKRLSLVLIVIILVVFTACSVSTEPTTLSSTAGSTLPNGMTQPSTTIPPSTTENSVPPTTTEPPVTEPPVTEPPVTEPPTEEDRVADAALAFLELHMRNLWLCEENDWAAFTVLAAPEEFITETDQHNIRFLTEKERYWREVRKDDPRINWETNVSFPSIVIENGIATVSVNFGASFYYEGFDVLSGFVAEYDLILRNVEGQWLLADARLRNDWFDETYHDVPGFTADELIAELFEVQEIQNLIRTMLYAHVDNMFLYTDHDFRDCTILALSEEQSNRTISIKGQECTIRDLFHNIEWLSVKEEYWKRIREGIERTDFEKKVHFPEFSVDGDYLTLEIRVGLGYQYVDSDIPSGESLTFHIDLLQVDGQWYICDVTELWSYIDSFKDDPDFNLDDLF